MTTTGFTAADNLLAWAAEQGPWESWTPTTRTEYAKRMRALDDQERHAASHPEDSAFFTDNNRSPDKKLHLSPSGRYRLEISSYKTTGSGWDYTRGEVFRVADGEKVADLKRNLYAFPFLWMEDHVDGHDWLVAGEDYQGQSFVRLDDGFVRHALPADAVGGFGFCWASHQLLDDKMTLQVEGCFWACPYEVRFYDVRDPSSGWPEITCPVWLPDGQGGNHYTTLTWNGGLLELEEGERFHIASGKRAQDLEIESMDAFKRRKTAERDGAPPEELAALSSAFEAACEAQYDEEDSNPAEWGKTPHHRVTLRREGLELVQVNEWKSDELVKGEERQRQDQAKALEDHQRWKRESELWNALAAHIGSTERLHALSGWSGVSMNDRDLGDKNPMYFRLSGRVYEPDAHYKHGVEIAWGVDSGDIEIRCSIRGQNGKKTVFPRTVEGILAAWDVGQEHLRSENGVGQET